MQRHYWGYRIDTSNIDYFRNELESGVLRQGWGYNKEQNLKKLAVDEGARRNLPIYQKVKKGDILLVPRCPTWSEVGIVEAAEDFDAGYRFEIDGEIGDYGHMFPARLLKSFDRNNENISGAIRSTIKNISRFWNIDHCGQDIDKLLLVESADLKSVESYEQSFGNAVAYSFGKAFNSKDFNDCLYESSVRKFSNEEWEYALVEGFRSYFPDPCVVERTGGRAEVDHGTDILITLPGLLGYQYLIAIQVKDYSGFVADDPIEQICKADKYWNQENRRVIEKIVIITKADRKENHQLTENRRGVKVIFISELKELLGAVGRTYLGLVRA